MMHGGGIETAMPVDAVVSRADVFGGVGGPVGGVRRQVSLAASQQGSNVSRDKGRSTRRPPRKMR